MEIENVIEVRGLGVAFDNEVILSDVNFTARKGEVTVILGGSGSGKTTVLKHLLGLYPVQTGFVSVLGRDISHLKEDEQIRLYLKMGVFFQDGALLNSLTVAENVALPLEQHTNLSKPLIRDIVHMKLGLVNLEHAWYLYPSQLSGGMLKRAALARAIAMDPPILFCDEPGAGLDPVSLKSLDDLILNLKNQLGMSVIMVTHEVLSIMRVADKIVFLEKGTTVYEGDVKTAVDSEIPVIKNFFSVLVKP
jgi:phospholipid/cholesterol/gamma-HCH transport system ATP-binding protein